MTESDCEFNSLSAQELARIGRAAKAVDETALDRATISMCRHRSRDWFNVAVETIPIPQADGSERWRYLVCNSDYLRNAPWKCKQGAEYRGVRAAWMAAASPVQVVIPADMEAALAHRHVLMAFSLLAQPGETSHCEYVEGMKTMPEIITRPYEVRRALSSLRQALQQGDGRLSLGLDPDGFALSHYPLNVHFVLGPGSDAAPRVRCWSESIVVVTS